MPEAVQMVTMTLTEVHRWEAEMQRLSIQNNALLRQLPPVPLNALRFTILGNPVPKERARYSPKNKVHFTPAKTRHYEAMVGQVAQQHGAHLKRIRRGTGKRDITSEGVGMELRIFFPDGRCSDAENVSKSICDGLNGVAYDDDSQIRRLLLEKRVDRVNPRVEVLVYPFEWAG